MSRRAREQNSVARSRMEAKKARWDLGWAARAWGLKEAASVLNQSLNKTQYWRQKVLDPLFRPGECGGTRRRFDPTKEREICAAIKSIVEKCPTKTYGIIVDDVYRMTGHIVSKAYVATVLAVCDFTCVVSFHLIPSCVNLLTPFLIF